MSLCSQQENRNFMLKRVSRMSPRDAKLAVMQERPHADLNVRCSQQFVHHAAMKQGFLSDPVKTVLYIAVSALQR